MQIKSLICRPAFDSQIKMAHPPAPASTFITVNQRAIITPNTHIYFLQTFRIGHAHRKKNMKRQKRRKFLYGSWKEAALMLLILPHQKHSAICRASVLIGSPSNLNHIWFLIAFSFLFIINSIAVVAIRQILSLVSAVQ